MFHTVVLLKTTEDLKSVQGEVKISYARLISGVKYKKD